MFFVWDCETLTIYSFQDGDFQRQKYKGSDVYPLDKEDLVFFFEDYVDRYDLDNWSGKQVWFISNDLENAEKERLHELFETADHFTLSLVRENKFKIEYTGDIRVARKVISLFALLGLAKEEKLQVDIKVLVQKEVGRLTNKVVKLQQQIQRLEEEKQDLQAEVQQITKKAEPYLTKLAEKESLFQGVQDKDSGAVNSFSIDGILYEEILVREGIYWIGTMPEYYVNSKNSISNIDPMSYGGYRVKITRPFWMGKFVITQDLFFYLMPHLNNRIGGSRYPALSSWIDAISFCNRLSERVGLQPVYSDRFTSLENVRKDHLVDKVYRSQKLEVKNWKTMGGFCLPSEAEWEIAARAGQYQKFSGSDTCQEVAHFGSMIRVGTLKPNQWGFHDMSGNILEWCRDTYERSRYLEEQVDPLRLRSNLSPGMTIVCKGNSKTFGVGYTGRSKPYEFTNSLPSFRVIRSVV